LILTQRLRTLWGDTTPIIILSGDHSLAMLNSLPHVGATYFFAKPVNPPMLLDRLRELMAPKNLKT
jgi:DNA-binding response OmpR family regulator